MHWMLTQAQHPPAKGKQATTLPEMCMLKLPMFLPEHSRPAHLRVLHAILLPGSKHPKRLPLHHRSCERK
jgi:hypothetical protein